MAFKVASPTAREKIGGRESKGEKETKQQEKKGRDTRSAWQQASRNKKKITTGRREDTRER